MCVSYTARTSSALFICFIISLTAIYSCFACAGRTTWVTTLSFLTYSAFFTAMFFIFSIHWRQLNMTIHGIIENHCIILSTRLKAQADVGKCLCKTTSCDRQSVRWQRRLGQHRAPIVLLRYCNTL